MEIQSVETLGLEVIATQHGFFLRFANALALRHHIDRMNRLLEAVEEDLLEHGGEGADEPHLYSVAPSTKDALHFHKQYGEQLIMERNPNVEVEDA